MTLDKSVLWLNIKEKMLSVQGIQRNNTRCWPSVCHESGKRKEKGNKVLARQTRFEKQFSKRSPSPFPLDTENYTSASRLELNSFKMEFIQSVTIVSPTSWAGFQQLGSQVYWN